MSYTTIYSRPVLISHSKIKRDEIQDVLFVTMIIQPEREVSVGRAAKADSAVLITDSHRRSE